MTIKDYFTKTNKHFQCNMWDTFTPFIKTLIVIIGFIWFIPPLILILLL